MRKFLAVWALIGSLGAGMTAALAENVPILDIQRTCRGIARHASGPGERGGPDLSSRQCINSELKVRKRLVRRWSSFSPAERANCVAQTNVLGVPSYSDLITCLEMAKDARSRGFRRPPSIER